MQFMILLLSFTLSASGTDKPVCKEQPAGTVSNYRFSEEEKIRTLVGQFFKALSAFDFKGAREYTYQHEDCEKVFGMLTEMSKDPEVKKNPAPTIKEIRTGADTARVTFVETPMPMLLEKLGDNWKIHMCGKRVESSKVKK